MVITDMLPQMFSFKSTVSVELLFADFRRQVVNIISLTKLNCEGEDLLVCYLSTMAPMTLRCAFNSICEQPDDGIE